MSNDARPATDPSGASLGRVAVIGAGSMGSGIAQVAAAAGHEVSLVDAAPGFAEQAVERLRAGLQKRVDQGKTDQATADATIGRITVVGGAEELPECVLVVEAVVERLDVKQQLFATLAAHQPASTILATNTSSLSVTDVADGVPHPERVVGLHFFNPAQVMKLVEVIRGAQTSEETLDAVTALARAWGKTPVRCTSTPGFIVNRVARPFYGEAQRMVAEGIAEPAVVDECLRRAGFPMGPLELTDLIGQDVNLAVGTSVWEQTGRDPRYEPTDYQRELVAAGRLGRKSGAGVYSYPDGAPAADPATVAALEAATDPADVRRNPAARTIAMLVNEAVDLVRRGEATEEDVDTAMRLGTGYPKGPIAWGREIGLDVVAARLAALDAHYPGGRYRPSPALRELAARSDEEAR